jgi:hypothetical protein
MKAFTIISKLIEAALLLVLAGEVYILFTI